MTEDPSQMAELQDNSLNPGVFAEPVKGSQQESNDLEDFEAQERMIMQQMSNNGQEDQKGKCRKIYFFTFLTYF